MLVVATVGSDHHPFDRLVRWVDSWAATHPSAEVWCQHGPATPPVTAAGAPFVPWTELLGLFRRAAAVVTAAGPGTVIEALDAGIRPIVVPRRPSIGEIVDGHQIEFAAVLADTGEAVLCQRRHELHDALDLAFADPNHYRAAARARPEPVGRARVRQVVEELLG